MRTKIVVQGLVEGVYRSELTDGVDRFLQKVGKLPNHKIPRVTIQLTKSDPYAIVVVQLKPTRTLPWTAPKEIQIYHLHPYEAGYRSLKSGRGWKKVKSGNTIDQVEGALTAIFQEWLVKERELATV